MTIVRMMGLIRVYTKRKGEDPDFSDPLILSNQRNGITIEAACRQVDRKIIVRYIEKYSTGSVRHLYGV